MAETTLTMMIDGEVIWSKTATEEELAVLDDWETRAIDLVPYSVNFQPNSDAIMTAEMTP